MSSTLNCEVLPKIPPLVEELRAAVISETETCNTSIMELAKQSGAPQFIEDAKKVVEVNNALRDMVIKCIGEESDTVGNEGTVLSAYNAGKKLEKALGGEM